MSNKTFQELNLNNGFLFPAAMEDPVTCRLVLEWPGIISVYVFDAL